MVKENSMSVFQFLHPLLYYLRHPLEFFEEIWYMMKRAYQRAIKGYCSWDRANMAYALPLYLINVLEDFVENNNCFPISKFDWEENGADESGDSKMLKAWNAEIQATIQALRDSIEGFPEGYDNISVENYKVPCENGVDFTLPDEYWDAIAKVNRWRAERFKTAWDWIAENLTFLQLG